MIKRGATRTVILVCGYAVKVPRLHSWRAFLNGLLANMTEREFAATGWPELCPVRFSLPGGWLIVMDRAFPLTDEQWASFDPEAFCCREKYAVPAEMKRSSFGLMSGRIVAVDYG